MPKAIVTVSEASSVRERRSPSRTRATMAAGIANELTTPARTSATLPTMERRRGPTAMDAAMPTRRSATRKGARTAIWASPDSSRVSPNNTT
jgi:hypothetical protein